MIFIDTSYLVALAVRSDALHGRAVALSNSLAGSFVTTEYVVLEFVNSLSAAALRARAHAMLEQLTANGAVAIEPVRDDLLRAGLALHRQRADKDWSLTDCVSFVVMRQRGIEDALAFDQHFVQAGFRALMREVVG